MSDTWSILGIPPVRDRDAIRRAYARRLKVTSPEDDAEAFAALRSAYEEAIASLDWDWAWSDEEPATAETIPATGLAAAIKLDAELTAAFVQVKDAPARDEPPARPHEPLLGQLEILLRAEPPPATGAVEAVFEDLMTSQTLQEVAVQVDVEMRVLELILDNIPRSDPLVKPAIKTFGWTRGGVISRRDSLVDAVLNRDSDIGFRKGISSPGVQLYAAYDALSGPITTTARLRAWLSPMLDQDVRTLFREIDTRRPTLAADLDPGAYAWWRERLSKPGLAAWMLWLVVCTPILAGVVGGLIQGSTKDGLLVWAGVQAGTFLLGMLYIYGYARPRDWWQSELAWRAPGLARVGWAPASWLLMLFATIAPPQPWILVLLCVAATAVLAWCLITRQVDATATAAAWLIRGLLTEIFLIIWWIMLSIDPSIDLPASVQVAAATAIVVSMIGSFSLISFWHGETSELARLYSLAALGVAFAVGVALLFGDLRGETIAAPEMTIGFISALVLATRPAAVAVEELSNILRARVLLPGAFFGYAIIKAVSGHWLAVGGIWMLAGAAITLAVAGVQSLKSATRQ
ncbi:MAG: J domain-containing protein [Proteobacteria bacterium]|nr:J domain-containing protein [Pseudomonadota bacterium]